MILYFNDSYIPFNYLIKHLVIYFINSFIWLLHYFIVSLASLSLSISLSLIHSPFPSSCSHTSMRFSHLVYIWLLMISKHYQLMIIVEELKSSFHFHECNSESVWNWEFVNRCETFRCAVWLQPKPKINSCTQNSERKKQNIPAPTECVDLEKNEKQKNER